ncbi:unnamed protein product [Caenorhabditis bovis]|uniref:K Homology domain-containing protein n=1 Tax=Caenorhabditis bovis TaxID=2654633 RepID=A0A8S1EX56_9PELO|nr:unnamed protein product [Caenorhabditis bovis]
MMSSVDNRQNNNSIEDNKVDEVTAALLTPPATDFSKKAASGVSTASIRTEVFPTDHSISAEGDNCYGRDHLFQNPSEFEPLYESAEFTKNYHSGDFAHQITKENRITITETLYVPVKKYPKYNFVGRILGPRGMTVKQLEKETGCKIFVRGRASNMAFNPHTKMMRGGVISNKSSLSTISQGALTDDPLHVYIEVTDYETNAKRKMSSAVSIIKDLLSPPADGKDELKRQQLVDISLINGTYRPTPATANSVHRPRRINHAAPNVTLDPTSAPIEELQRMTLNRNDNAQKLEAKNHAYRIPQQRKWHSPRGFEQDAEEYANSTSSREYVTDIVNKTKQAARVIFKDDGTCDEESTRIGRPLSPATVAESLKLVQSLIDSHKNIPIGKIGEPQSTHSIVDHPVLDPTPVLQPPIDYSYYPAHMTSVSDSQAYMYPPPQQMVDFIPSPYYPSRQSDSMPLPPPPPPMPLYPLPGLVYMLPGSYIEKFVPQGY